MDGSQLSQEGGGRRENRRILITATHYLQADGQSLRRQATWDRRNRLAGEICDRVLPPPTFVTVRATLSHAKGQHWLAWRDKECVPLKESSPGAGKLCTTVLCIEVIGSRKVAAPAK